MSQPVNHADKGSVNRNAPADPTAVESLISALRSHDGMERQRARQSLVAIGEAAVALLTEATTDPNRQVRWEAVKALGEIGDPAAAPALVAALEDEESGVRWLAAEGLIALERDGLVSLLQALEERSQSVWLREGAHHVLHELTADDLRDVMAPVLAALENIEPILEVPVVARAARKALEGTTSRRGDQALPETG